MASPATTLRIFGLYLLALAVVLLCAPNILLGLFGIAPTSEVWIRVAGMLAGFLGYYYLRAAAAGLHAFFVWSVQMRLCVPLFFATFVVLGLAPRALLLFAALDAAGAGWTWLALRRTSTHA